MSDISGEIHARYRTIMHITGCWTMYTAYVYITYIVQSSPSAGINYSIFVYFAAYIERNIKNRWQLFKRLHSCRVWVSVYPYYVYDFLSLFWDFICILFSSNILIRSLLNIRFRLLSHAWATAYVRFAYGLPYDRSPFLSRMSQFSFNYGDWSI